MKKTRILFYLLLFAIGIQNATAQQSVVAASGNASGSGGNVSYSIGQIAYTTSSGSGGSVNQGVQQPFEIATLGNNNFPEITLTMSAYPNPTTSIINLKIDNLDFENLQFYLTDVNGKEIEFRKITDLETQIQMENLPKSVYFLNVSDNKKQLKTFKIIKN